MTSITIPMPQIELFLLIFLRVSAMLMTIPLFESRAIPALFKVGLSFALSLLLLPLVPLHQVPATANLLMFVMGVVREVGLGLMMGLAVQLCFGGIQLAGQLAGFQMGLAIVNVMDPQRQQIPVLSQFNQLVAMLVFVAINAHHWLLRAMVESFRLVPPFQMQYGDALFDYILKLAGNMFIIALKVSAPVMVALILTSVAMGLIARTVPQMHIFIVAIPLKIFIGLVFLGLTLPFFVHYLVQLLQDMGADIWQLISLCRPGG